MKIKDFIVGNTIEATLVVKTAVARETRAKKPYLAIEFFDGTDTISGNYWDWTTGNIPAINSILDVKAQVTEWQGVKQLNIKTLKSNPNEHLANFVPKSSTDISQVYKDAYALMSTVCDDDLRNLALAVLEELRNEWLTVPGAVSVHHAYVGGTLIHSYSVAKLAVALASEIPEANRDLCVVGAMLHDIGKLFTYKINGVTIDMSNEGRLFDHIFMGAEFIGNFADSHLDTDDTSVERKLRLLRHIILSHHGKLEYGSPVMPQCIEAHIVCTADGLDAAVEQIRTAALKTPENSAWTERIYTLGNKQSLTPKYVEAVLNPLPF